MYQLKLKLGFMLILICTSCISAPGLSELKAGLDKLIGSPFASNPTLKYWKEINSSEMSTEFEKTLPSGCSYAVLVDKHTGLIQSWRITSNLSLCDSAGYVVGA